MAAPIKAKYSRILVNEFDLSTQHTSIEASVSTEQKDVSTFQNTAKAYLSMTPEGAISITGFFDDAAAGYTEQELAESVENAETLYVAALFGTQTAACPVFVAPATSTDNVSITAPVDGVIEVTGSFPSGTGLRRGLRCFSGTISATGAQTYIDLASAGSAGGLAWLWVQTITGTATNATITVQSDDNTGFSSAATEATFTFSAVGGYQVTLSGTIDRYVRLNCTSLGGATSFVVVGAVAVTGVTG
jgi:hypothetical protein